MAKSIQLTLDQWSRLREQLKDDYTPSVVLLRSKMKDTLGFIPRRHQWTEPGTDKHGNPQDKFYRVIMLDFYSEKRCTWFLMKYGDFIHER